MSARPGGGSAGPAGPATTPLYLERDRTVLRVHGRDPVKMVQGLATADLGLLSPERALYTTFLTPKGRMVADARLFLRPGARSGQRGPGADGTPELLLTTDPSALAGLLEHLRKFVPPLFARFDDISDHWRVVAVHGPGASEAAGKALGAIGVEARTSSDMAEESLAAFSAEPPALAVRSRETGGDGWELLLGADHADAAVEALEQAGARRADETELERLRVQAGRPRWGAELTGDVIPIEAGLLGRAISQTKGCYTGQEVIVRILHRGHVNRHLRALAFEGTAAEPGTELFEAGSEKPRGVVTSVADDRGLGFVRREIEPPAELHAGTPDGPPVRVSAIRD